MKIEVLVATMHQKDYSLIDKMNISTDAIIGNQCDINKVEEMQIDGNKIKWLSFNETGVGLNRNNTLMRSQADICIFADDDMVYVDNYKDIVMKAFEKYKDADVIIFNIYENPIKRYVITKPFRVRWYNFMRFGAARIAVNLKSVRRENIFFNLNFGGGTKYGSGEDTLFLHDCIISGLKVIAVPSYIAILTERRSSTWFKGYNNKYFYDKGALFACMYGKLAWIICPIMLIKHIKVLKKRSDFLKQLKNMLKSINDYNKE